MKLTAEQFTTALRAASQRGLLPSALSSAQLQRVLTASERRRVLALARVTRAAFLSEAKKLVTAMMAEELGNSPAQVIAGLKGVLQRLGYTPETGFTGDAEHDIPPAGPGSLQDLSSWKRLSLILETERALANGYAENLNGNTDLARELFPAWELVRIETREQPRGSIDSGSPGWATRWVDFGGPPLTDSNGQLRMIAGKADPIWQRMGDQAMLEAHGISDLALGVDYPPFCIRSGMGRFAVSRTQVERLGVVLRGEPKPLEQVAELPAVKTEARSLDDATRAKLQARLALINQALAA